ncbi:hypothetical protein [Nocardiopsis lucentensis]|uniref:hypothetical protein n=1 Tax=Nocardiopsis lucentensis TaxID=53441 RepID=UPI000344EB25|nr:hypothetical protein [Nocardiopsis lucentensis]
MITFVGSEFAGTFVDSVTVDRPADVVAGDQMIMFASANDENELVTVPSGWAVLSDVLLDPGADAKTWVLARVADDSEPDTYTVTWGGTHWHFLDLVAFRGVDRIRSQSTNSGGGLSEIDLPVLQANEGDALVAGGFHWDEVGKAWTPAGLTVIDNLPRSWISAWQTITTDGPTTEYTLETSPTTVGLMSAIAILLVPDPDPPGPVTFPLDIRTEIQLDGVWTDISTDVRDTDDVVITRGRSDWAGRTDPATMTLRLNNRDGRYSPRNPNSPYFGVLRRNTPIRLSLIADGDPVTRFAGEVPEWPLEWDLSGNDTWVDLRAAGLLRRFAQGSGPERSAIRRLIRTSGALAYWPLTDGAGATFSATPDVGPHPMLVTDLIRTAGGTITPKIDFLDWAQGNLEPWLEPVARTRTDRGAITGRVDPVATSPVAWTADLVRARTGGTDRYTITSHLDDNDDGVQWRVRMDYSAPDIRIFVRSFTGSPTGTFTELTVIDEPRFFGEDMRHLRLSVTENGSDSDWALYIDGDLIDSGTAVGFTARAASTVTYSWDFIGTFPDDAEAASFGHIAVWDSTEDLVIPSAADVRRALDGYPGERAGVRIQRIADEESITLQVVGDLEKTPAMGPQYAETALEVMRDAEQVDRGVLFESRDDAALVYRTNRSRYNQHLGGV